MLHLISSCFLAWGVSANFAPQNVQKWSPKNVQCQLYSKYCKICGLVWWLRIYPSDQVQLHSLVCLTGGSELSLMGHCLVTEELAYACTAISTAIDATDLGVILLPQSLCLLRCCFRDYACDDTAVCYDGDKKKNAAGVGDKEGGGPVF